MMEVGDVGMKTSTASFDEFDDANRIGESGGFACAWVCVWVGTGDRGSLTLSSADMISIILEVDLTKKVDLE
jgi:hypothetical protein